MRYLLGGLLFATSARALAAAGDTAGFASLLISLVLILGLFVLAAWLVRRYLPQVGRPGPVKVIGATMLGAREKVVVVEIRDTWLVLGVGAGQIRTLHTLPRAAEAESQP